MGKSNKPRIIKSNPSISRYGKIRHNHVKGEIPYRHFNQMVKSRNIVLLDKNFSLPASGNVKVERIGCSCISGTGLLPNRPPIRRIVIATEDGRKCRGVIKTRSLKAL